MQPHFCLGPSLLWEGSDSPRGSPRSWWGEHPGAGHPRHPRVHLPLRGWVSAMETRAPPGRLLIRLAEGDQGFPPQGGSPVTYRRDAPTSSARVSSDLTCRAAVWSGLLGVALGPTLTLGNLETICGVTRQLWAPASPGTQVEARVVSAAPGPGLQTRPGRLLGVAAGAAHTRGEGQSRARAPGQALCLLSGSEGQGCTSWAQSSAGHPSPAPSFWSPRSLRLCEPQE